MQHPPGLLPAAELAHPSASLSLRPGVTVVGALPVALLVRDRHMISAFSAASVAFVLLFAAVIALLALAPTGAAVTGAAAGRLLMWRSDGLLVALPVVAYGFTAHPYYLGIYSMLPAPSTGRMMQVTDMVSSAPHGAGAREASGRDVWGAARVRRRKAGPSGWVASLMGAGGEAALHGRVLAARRRPWPCPPSCTGRSASAATACFGAGPRVTCCVIWAALPPRG